ncbi:MAG: Appr-1-p processing protein [Phycisphaerales bacterium]
MTPITYLVGDATRPQVEGPGVIAHVCNDAGKWGAGFTGALSKRWPFVERHYREWYRKDAVIRPFGLGAVQFIPIVTHGDAGIDAFGFVANMIAQRGVGTDRVCVDYPSLRQCLERVASFALGLAPVRSSLVYSVHMPRIGCGLAGGSWDEVEPLLVETLRAKDVPVFVYDLPTERGRHRP